MHRTLVIAGALALALPSLTVAQDRHRSRRDHRTRSTGLSVSIGIGGGNTRVGVGIHTHTHRSTPVVRRVHHGGGFTVVGQRGDWYLVDYGNGRRGWVHCNDLPGYRHRGPTTVIVNERVISRPVVIAPPVVIRSNVRELDRFSYRRVLKHGGALQSQLSLVRLSDGTFQAELAGAGVDFRRVRITCDSVRELQSVLSRMQAFPDATFSQGVDTFHTTFSTEGRLDNGRYLRMSRAFYDPSYEPSSAVLANELHAAVDRLIASIAQRTGGGFLGTFR